MVTKSKIEIPSWLQSRLSFSDLDLVEEAVQKAELKTSAEIVPVIVRRSSTVGHVPLILFLLQMLLFALLGVSSWFEDNFIDWHWLSIVAIIVSILVSRFFARFEWVERVLTPKIDQQKQVGQRAELEFYESNIKNTAGATGVLIYLSLMERQAVVLADEAISSKLPKDTWQNVIQLILSGIKEKSIGQGLSNGIGRCADVLNQPFPRQSDDVDELPNHLVIKEF